MSKSGEHRPEIVVSQSSRQEEEFEYYNPAAEFVLVSGIEVHLWVDGKHFIEDPNGTIEEGQFFLISDPGMGKMLSVIEEVNEESGLVTVRHLFHWTDGELSSPDYSETWDRKEITGDFDRAMGDASSRTFLKSKNH